MLLAACKSKRKPASGLTLGEHTHSRLPSPDPFARSRALLKGKPARWLPTDGRGRLSRLFFSDGGARKPLGIRLLFQTIDKIF